MDQTIENIGSFIMIIAVFLIVAWVIIAAFSFALKKRMIDRGHIDEESRNFLLRPVESRLQNIKWGLLFFFGGAGLITCEFLPWRGDNSPLPYGVEAVYIAVGFIVYYFIARDKKPT